MLDGALTGLTPIPDLNASALLSGLPDLTVSADLVDSAREEGGRLGADFKTTPALLGSAAEIVVASIGETDAASMSSQAGRSFLGNDARATGRPIREPGR